MVAGMLGPHRSDAAPLNGATSAIESGTDMSSSPASTGEYPAPPISRNGSRKVAVKIPQNATTTLASPAVNGRMRNSARSISGWADARSAITNAAPRTMDTATSPSVAGLVQPQAWPSLRARSRANRAPPDRAAPRMSKVLPGPGVSAGSTRAAHTMARIPIGTLMRKIARHEAAWVRMPPSTGPSVRPSETLMPLSPSARPRSPAGNVRVMIAGPIAMIMAAPTAWTSRKATRAPALGAAPHRTLATVKIANPAM